MAKRAVKATVTAKDIVPTAAAIKEFGYVRALIRARSEAGFPSANKGKVRAPKA